MQTPLCILLVAVVLGKLLISLGQYLSIYFSSLIEMPPTHIYHYIYLFSIMYVMVLGFAFF